MSTIHAVGQNPEDLHKYIITSCIFIASFIQGSQSALRIFIKTPQKPCKVIQNYSALGSSQPGRPAQGDGSASPRSRPKAAAAAGEEPVPTAPRQALRGRQRDAGVTAGTSPKSEPDTSHEEGAGRGENSICPTPDFCFKQVLSRRCRTRWGQTMLRGPPAWPSAAVSLWLIGALQPAVISVRARKYLMSCFPSHPSTCSLEVIYLCFIHLSPVIFVSIILHDPFFTPYWGKQEW